MNAWISEGSVSVLVSSPHCVLPFLVIWWEAKSEDGRCPVLLAQPHLARSWYRGLRNGDFSPVLSAIWLLKLCLESVACWGPAPWSSAVVADLWSSALRQHRSPARGISRVALAWRGRGRVPRASGSRPWRCISSPRVARCCLGGEVEGALPASALTASLRLGGRQVKPSTAAQRQWLLPGLWGGALPAPTPGTHTSWLHFQKGLLPEEKMGGGGGAALCAALGTGVGWGRKTFERMGLPCVGNNQRPRHHSSPHFKEWRIP